MPYFFVSSMKQIPLNWAIYIFSYCQFQNDFFSYKASTQKILYDRKIHSWLQLVISNSIPLRKVI